MGVSLTNSHFGPDSKPDLTAGYQGGRRQFIKSEKWADIDYGCLKYNCSGCCNMSEINPTRNSSNLNKFDTDVAFNDFDLSILDLLKYGFYK